MARRPRGELEEAALTAVHAAGHPVSVADVVQRLDGTSAYTTVMTTLTRLVSKGLLLRETRGRGYLYAPAVALDDAESARAARNMRRLLDAEGRRADVLARFVAELDPADERLLREVLQRGPGPDGRGGGTTPGAREELGRA